MKNKPKKTFTICSIVFFLVIASFPIASNAKTIDIESLNIELSGITEDLYLLHGEHYLYIEASKNTSSFNVKYAFPPDYGYQIPIFLEILDDTNASIINYEIINDTNEPNKVINFTIDNMKKDERVLIHFNCWVLIKNHDYSDLPDKVSIPKKKDDYPDEVQQWLNASKVVQSDKFLLKRKARQLKFLTFDVLKLANKIAKFSREHRYLLFLLQYYIFGYRAQDALTTLLINGECPGRSHLGCALFRANNIPARVLLANPTYNFAFEMHYMTEYYLQDYDWVLTEVHGGKTPHEPKNQIILRICHPEDENNTQTDFIYPKMKYIERWLWIDTENVTPYYVNLKEGSRIKTFEDKKIAVDSVYTGHVMNLTRDVYNQFQYYQGMNLTGENKGYFENATNYQMDAINGLKEPMNPLFNYYFNMGSAHEEYNKIMI